MDRSWRAAYEEVVPQVRAAFSEQPVDGARLSALLSSVHDLPAQDAVGVYAAIVDGWLESRRGSFRWARRASDRLFDAVKNSREFDPEDFVTWMLGVFEHTGYMKDYKAAERLARYAGQSERLDEVDEVIRRELPDVWVQRALQRGDVEAALDCWFENEDHSRIRLAADDVLDVAGDRVDVVLSAQLSLVNHWIRRGGRRRYRRVCKLLKALRRELEEFDELAYWPLVLEDLQTRHARKPALLDEMAKAKLIEAPP